jgi:predicted nucleic acid-binding protein
LLTTDAMMRSCGQQCLTSAQAWRAYDRLRADPRIGFAHEVTAFEPLWKRFTDRGMAAPKLWMDAYLAAFAIAGDHQFVTSDKAFTQFSGLKLIIL